MIERGKLKCCVAIFEGLSEERVSGKERESKREI